MTMDTAPHAHLYGDPRCTCPKCDGSNPAYQRKVRTRRRVQPTPAAQLLDISKRMVSRKSLSMKAAQILAQQAANRLGKPIALGWQLNDDTGRKELGWCPASIAPHNCFVIEVLETINPQEKR
jgi:hypothetical protein